MPLDGIVVRNIVLELNSCLIDGRIDRITQPEKDEVDFTVRNRGKGYRLLLSSSSSYPRVNLTDMQKQSPSTAPMFCMVLRKHLSGGRIVGIEQYSIDRVIKFHIESYDELGTLSVKILICEIMGRHSNIILINEADGRIIDSIRRITPDMSSFRQILPGLQYRYPPSQDKLNPLCFDGKEFFGRLNGSGDTVKLGRFLAGTIDGINIFAAREICYRAGLDEDVPVSSLDNDARKMLSAALNGFTASALECRFAPCIYYHGDDAVDFYCMKLSYLGYLNVKDMPSVSDALEEFYRSRDTHDRLRQKSSDMLKVINSNLNRCCRKLAIQQEKLKECGQKDRWRLYGDLIMSNLYKIRKGDSSADAADYFDGSGKQVEIPLDIALTPVENAQRYYKRYNKEKNAEAATEIQKRENQEEIEYLESQLVNIENCTEPDELNEIRDELVSLSYIKTKRSRKRQKITKSKPLHYISSDGHHIYVGKNNVQNDYLTTRFADPGDIWMHTKKIPGSHVIIKRTENEVTKSAIEEGAMLASYYSKARNSSNVPVDYTERRNVKKPSGAKPGMVVYYTNRTLYVTPDGEFIKRLEVQK